MICKVRSCQNYEKTTNNDGECILELLDLVKLHYFHIKTDLKDKSSNIFQLETVNLTLNKTIDNLRQQVQLYESTPVKRKKTNSPDYSDSIKKPTSNIFTNIALNIDDKHNTTDDLNNAINSNAGLEDSCNVFISPAKPIDLVKSPKKEIESPRLALSPLNNNKKSPIKLTPVKDHLRQNQNETPVKFTPTKISHYLPKRIITKETPSGKRIDVGIENKPLESKTLRPTTAGWISTEKKLKKKSKLSSSKMTFVNRGLEFIQPVKHEKNNSLDNSSESIASSQTLISKQSSRKDRNLLSLRNPKMRQARLEFDRRRINIQTGTHIADESKTDDTFCDEIVGASPDIELKSVKKENNCLTQKSLRKINRKNSDDELFNISIKKTTATESNIQASTSTVENAKRSTLKMEPKTTKKSYVTNLFPLVESKKDPNEPMISDDSIDLYDLTLDFEPTKRNIEGELSSESKNFNSTSVVILPSEPDDVIIVEETENNYDFDGIDSVNLIKEILQNQTGTQLGLKSIEKERFLTSKKSYEKNISAQHQDLEKIVKLENESNCFKSDQQDYTQLNTIDNMKMLKQQSEEKELLNNKPKIKSPITLNSVGHNCDCRNCNSYLRYLISLNLTRDEIKVRLKDNNKHAEKPLKLHLTPEGFWDPIMRDFSPGDPRNEVIIDTRFIDRTNKDNKISKGKI